MEWMGDHCEQGKVLLYLFSLYSEYTFMLKFLQLFVTHHAKMVDAVFCLVTAPVHLAG